METRLAGGAASTTLTAEDRRKLLCVARELGHHARVQPLGRYQALKSADIWRAIVSQVCVMGSARGIENMPDGSAERRMFDKETSLAAWKTHGFRRAYMVGKLDGATRFPGRAADRLKAIVRTDTAVSGTTVVLLEGLNHDSAPHEVRRELMRRCPLFKLKSASDFMITMGLSDDVMALDTRVVGFLQRRLGFNLKAGQVQGSPEAYSSVEAALRPACGEAGITLAVLDRTIFQLSGVSALDFAMDKI